MYENTIGKCCVSYGLFIYHSKKSHFQRDIGTKLDKNHCFNCYRCLPIPFLRIRTHTQLQECFSVSLIQRVKEKVYLSVTDAGFVHNWRQFFQTTKNHIQSSVNIVWEINLEIFWYEFTFKNRFRQQKLCFGPQFWCWKWIFLTDFLWQIWAKNTKINFSSESVKTKEHKESNSCDKYHFSINAFYKINLWPILKKLLQKIDFHHFPLFEIIAQ